MPRQAIGSTALALSRHDHMAGTAHPFAGANDHPASPSFTMNTPSKVTAQHLQRAAYLYIRQSSLHQVFENTESTERQYALRRRARVAVPWRFLSETRAPGRFTMFTLRGVTL